MKQQKTKEQELSDGFKDGMKKEEKYPDKAIEYLNKCFPKGNKKRGEAMCLLAITLWEGKEMGKQEAKQEFQKDLNLARQCITMQLFKCKSKSCKNFSCVLNENKELKGERK